MLPEQRTNWKAEQITAVCYAQKKQTDRPIHLILCRWMRVLLSMCAALSSTHVPITKDALQGQTVHMAMIRKLYC